MIMLHEQTQVAKCLWQQGLACASITASVYHTLPGEQKRWANMTQKARNLRHPPLQLTRCQLQHLQRRDSLQKPGSAASIGAVWTWSRHRFDASPSHEVDVDASQGQTAG